MQHPYQLRHKGFSIQGNPLTFPQLILSCKNRRQITTTKMPTIIKKTHIDIYEGKLRLPLIALSLVTTNHQPTLAKLCARPAAPQTQHSISSQTKRILA